MAVRAEAEPEPETGLRTGSGASALSSAYTSVRPPMQSGTAVEVLYSWLPTDQEAVQMFDGTEQWFRGWITGARCVATGDNDRAGEHGLGCGGNHDVAGARWLYCVLYDDGDVEEDVPMWRMRTAGGATEADARASATHQTADPSKLSVLPAGARLVVTPPPVPSSEQ